MKSQMENNIYDELILSGTPPSKAKALAARIAFEKMSTLVALHNPDLVAGGRNSIGDFRGRSVNASIGSQ
ncbi:polymorphic toxin type 15 domain-containing protein [Pseudomonas sp. UBA1879]|uniref:polymorphic toxin type 15 domain-containing protein n=1 Tax=Pseudomonas sp. UBA1879 TaxID=1947305 RepID=UPI0039C8F142